MRIRNRCFIFPALFVCLVALSGCSYRHEIGTSHQTYSFSEFSGTAVNSPEIPEPMSLAVKIQLQKGHMSVRLTDPAGVEVFSADVGAWHTYRKRVGETCPAGKYSLAVTGDGAKGKVELLFRK